MGADGFNCFSGLPPALGAAVWANAAAEKMAAARINKTLIVISPPPSALPANVAGPNLSVSGAFNVKSQPLAFPDVVWIDACWLNGADVQKDIRTAGVVPDETEAAIGIPHFQSSGSHRALFSLRLLGRLLAPIFRQDMQDRLHHGPYCLRASQGCVLFINPSIELL
jgi:hypothetical protein